MQPPFHSLIFSRLLTYILCVILPVSANPIGHYSSSLDQVEKEGAPQGSSSYPSRQPRPIASQPTHQPCPTAAVTIPPTPRSGQSTWVSEERVQPPQDPPCPAPS